MSKRSNYYYIDETGSINNNADFFVLGLIKTEDPTTLQKKLEELKSIIFNDVYFMYHRDKFKEQGFHATDNHPDIRSKVFSLLPILNFRAYFAIMQKDGDFYSELKQSKTEEEIYSICLRKLLLNRLEKHKNENNIFYFEHLSFKNTTLNEILDDFFSKIKFSCNIEYHIVDKSVLNLGITDYLNYMIWSIINNSAFSPRMKENFKVISPKIASIYHLNEDKYYSRRTQSEFETILNSLVR